MSVIYSQNGILVKNGKIERNYAGMLESTAPTFDDSTAYAAGQYVVHNNEIRKFTEAHAAGSWKDSDNEAASLEDVLTDINTAIADKGVTVPSGSKLVDCPELITDIPSGGTSFNGTINTGLCTLTDGKYLSGFYNLSNYTALILGLSLNGKSVTIEINVKITMNTNSNCSICGPNSYNYRMFAMQYNQAQKQIWFAAPNAAQDGWQFEEWKSCDLGLGVYHKVRLEYIKDTNTLNGYVDNVLITTFQLSEVPNASLDVLKLGMNYGTSYPLQGVIDLSNSYIEADGVRQFN